MASFQPSSQATADHFLKRKQKRPQSTLQLSRSHRERAETNVKRRSKKHRNSLPAENKLCARIPKPYQGTPQLASTRDQQSRIFHNNRFSQRSTASCSPNEDTRLQTVNQ